jgi:hypothetical protein
MVWPGKVHYTWQGVCMMITHDGSGILHFSLNCRGRRVWLPPKGKSRMSYDIDYWYLPKGTVDVKAYLIWVN